MMPPRPRLRGVSHRIAFYVALVLGAVLVSLAGDRTAMAVSALYSVCLAGMFGVSASLHSRDWGPRAFNWLRRADHAMIFACIAGTYTPFCVLGLPPETGTKLLILAWAAAGLGILRAACWPHAPRVVTASLFVLVGWVCAFYFPEVRAGLAPLPFALLMTGGAWFTVGAVIYLTKRPDPWPTVFGYHEIFHGMVVLGCACHFVAVAHLVTAR
jgi:hemolysin III